MKKLNFHPKLFIVLALLPLWAVAQSPTNSNKKMKVAEKQSIQLSEKMAQDRKNKSTGDVSPRPLTFDYESVPRIDLGAAEVAEHKRVNDEANKILYRGTDKVES